MPSETIITDIAEGLGAAIPAAPTLIQDVENIGGQHGTGIEPRLVALENFVMHMAAAFGGLFPSETGVAKVLAAANNVAEVAASAQAPVIQAVETAVSKPATK